MMKTGTIGMSGKEEVYGRLFEIASGCCFDTEDDLGCHVFRVSD